MTDEKSVADAGRALLAHFGCAAVLITQGEKGMTLVEESSPRHVHIPATGVEVTYARIGQTASTAAPPAARSSTSPAPATPYSACWPSRPSQAQYYPMPPCLQTSPPVQWSPNWALPR
jgi:hypothetical protein